MKTRLFTFLAALCLLAAPALADSAAALRQRMAQRLPAVDSLKTAGAVGENNRGYLELRPGAQSDAGAIVSAENSDREAVYELIARETGATADSVGRARAKQIAANSHAGVWVQDESGAWKKK